MSDPAFPEVATRYGAIILCGGLSRRMGRDKATLPFGSELMLQRIVRILGSVVDDRAIVVVAARDQKLPALPANILVVADKHPDRGPLEGLSSGLQAMPDDVEAIYLASCDSPFPVPEFVTAMFESLGEHDIAVPFDEAHHYPFAAAYCPRVLSVVESLLRSNCLRLQILFEQASTKKVHVSQLRAVDPDLLTLMNLNHLEDYHAALRLAGFAD